MSDGFDDYIDMHHKIRRSVRKRLKQASLDLEKPVVEIVNQAIAAWLERHEGEDEREVVTNSMLREAIREGAYFELVAGLGKDEVIRLLEKTGDVPDGRLALDRLVLRLRERLSPPGER